MTRIISAAKLGPSPSMPSIARKKLLSFANITKLPFWETPELAQWGKTLTPEICFVSYKATLDTRRPSLARDAIASRISQIMIAAVFNQSPDITREDKAFVSQFIAQPNTNKEASGDGNFAALLSFQLEKQQLDLLERVYNNYIFIHCELIKWHAEAKTKESFHLNSFTEPFGFLGTIMQINGRWEKYSRMLANAWGNPKKD